MTNLHESMGPGRDRTFVEIDHEIISTVILLPSADSLLVFLLCCGCSVEMLASAASIVRSYQNALNYDWYGDCLFSYCVVGAQWKCLPEQQAL